MVNLSDRRVVGQVERQIRLEKPTKDSRALEGGFASMAVNHEAKSTSRRRAQAANPAWRTITMRTRPVVSTGRG